MSGSTLSVYPKRLSSCMKSLDDCASSVTKLTDQLNTLCSNVSKNDSGMNEVKQYLNGVIQRLKKDQMTCKFLSTDLGAIAGLYEKVDNEITGLITSGKLSGLKGQKAGTKAISTIGSLKKLSKQFAISYGDNFIGDLRNALMESSGTPISIMGGIIAYNGAFGRSAGSNAFVLVPRSVSDRALKYISAGRKINAGAAYGVPLLGAAIDFVSLKQSGQSTVDAGVKSVAHLGIGLAGGKIGGALGTLIGGPIVGTAIGFCAGTAISTIGNMTFDWVYDNHLKPGFKKAVKKIAGSCQAAPPIGAVGVSGF